MRFGRASPELWQSLAATSTTTTPITITITIAIATAIAIAQEGTTARAI